MLNDSWITFHIFYLQYTGFNLTYHRFWLVCFRKNNSILLRFIRVLGDLIKLTLTLPIHKNDGNILSPLTSSWSISIKAKKNRYAIAGIFLRCIIDNRINYFRTVKIMTFKSSRFLWFRSFSWAFSSSRAAGTCRSNWLQPLTEIDADYQFDF